ncbi:MAG: hypothetical protein HYY78_19795 [Betaproteobacteria bacterium]|nr:hypothetical protein [Betaproteobacteria bacterium]
MATKLDGQEEALKLLRHLLEMNSNIDRSAKSARLVSHTMLSMRDWPAAESVRFSRVISDWLVTELLGCVHSLDSYEAYLIAKARRSMLGKAKGDPQWQAFMGKLKLGQKMPAA